MRRELDIAENAARAAGEIVRNAVRQPIEVREKSRGNPVTEVDLQANEAIHSMIRAAFPDDGWLSEETHDSADRLDRRRVWIIDPLDGTKEFINQVPDLCVCVALVEDGEPVVGVSYNPILEEMFSAARGRGMTLNGAPARVSGVTELSRARILASRSESKRGEWEPVRPRADVLPMGSVAYKLALVAAGIGDVTFTLTPKNEWDVCSGVVLVREAGGTITDRYGKPLRFNQRRTTVPGVIATNGPLFDPIRRLIDDIAPLIGK